MTLLHQKIVHADGVARCAYCAKVLTAEDGDEGCDGPLPLRAALERIGKAEVTYGDANSLNASQLRQIARAALDSIPEPATGGAAGWEDFDHAFREAAWKAEDYPLAGVSNHRGIMRWFAKQAAKAIASHAPASPAIPDRPEIVCLCGSTRFKEAFERETRRLGLEGKIVLSVSMFGHSGDLKPEECADGHPTKAKLDELHKRKIDLADRVLVLNCLRPRCSACGHWQTVRMSNDGLSNCCMKPLVDEPYIGDSTRSEIEHATKRGKPIDYLNAPAPAPETPAGGEEGEASNG